MTSSAHSVSLQNVKRSFEMKGGSEPIRALRGVVLSIAKGSMVAIKGDSGSGKTTLLQIVGALDTPTSGTVLVHGQDLSAMSGAELTQYRANSVGFVFQSFNLIPTLSAVENVELALEARNVRSMERRARACDLLRLVGMGDRLNHKPSKLSGGEQQRVAIARALANDPPIILADEPTGNLDTKSSKAVVNLLRKLNRESGKTMLIVTHSDDVARTCDYVVTIKDGVAFSKLKEEMEEDERDRRRRMRETLQVSGKVVSKLFDADYTDLATVADADEDELAWAVGDKGLARSLIARAVTAVSETPGTERSEEDEGGDDADDETIEDE